MQVLASILGAEPSGRLYKALVETKKAASVSASAHGLHDPGHARDHGRGQHQGPGGAREGPRRDAHGRRRGRPARASPQEEVERARQQILKDRELAAADPNRIAVELSELGRAGRLAALLPRPRPAREGDARGGQGGRRQVPDARATAPSASSSPPPSPSGRRSRRRPTSPSWSRTTRAARSSRPARVVRRLAPGHRGPRPAARADRGRQARLPAQEDPRRGGPRCT